MLILGTSRASVVLAAGSRTIETELVNLYRDGHPDHDAARAEAVRQPPEQAAPLAPRDGVRFCRMELRWPPPHPSQEGAEGLRSTCQVRIEPGRHRPVDGDE